jgi:hypothetical protein
MVRGGGNAERHICRRSSRGSCGKRINSSKACADPEDDSRPGSSCWRVDFSIVSTLANQRNRMNGQRGLKTVQYTSWRFLATAFSKYGLPLLQRREKELWVAVLQLETRRHSDDGMKVPDNITSGWNGRSMADVLLRCSFLEV